MSEPLSLGAARVVTATDKALLVALADHRNRQVWVPKSQIHDDSEVYAAEQTGELIVTDWWAEKEGFA